ncbi:hypothetical protein [Oryza sativa Japonica Group]|nr:hypothetical protein [Oryza sativa Japonica Group]BAD53147.1 hypothetical protein [Oryza sativa Japonica Group]
MASAARSAMRDRPCVAGGLREVDTVVGIVQRGRRPTTVGWRGTVDGGFYFQQATSTHRVDRYGREPSLFR